MQQNYVNNNVSRLSLIPSIKTGQFNYEQEKIPDCVNLFRGDLNLPLQVMGIPGRDGLDVKLNLMYLSNDEYELCKPNSERGTGILGAGWEMPSSRIIVDHSRTTADYYLCEGMGIERMRYRGMDDDCIFFELENYQPWSIRYNTKAEQWDIIKENGIAFRFGGGYSKTEPSPYILWGIKWGGKNGNWYGSTSNNTSQAQIIKGWNLAVIESPHGAKIKYSYYPVNATVSGGSAVYTRETHLKSIEAFGDIRVDLIYGEKGSDEYVIPHKPPSITTPIAYQDNYETKYLKAVELRYANEDAPFNKYDFSYETICMATGYVKDKVAYNKRFLKAIEQKNQDNIIVSKHCFEYSKSGAEKGLLNKVTYPDGWSMAVNYKKISLGGTDLTSYISMDSVDGCWVGDYYAVAACINGKKFNVKIRGFSGSWMEYTTDITHSESIEKIDVVTEMDSFTLTVKGKTKASIYLFHERKGQFGKWSYDSFARDISCGGLCIGTSKTLVAYCFDNSADLYVACWNNRFEKWDEKRLYISDKGKYKLIAGDDTILISSFDARNKSAQFILYNYDRITDGWAGRTINKTAVPVMTDDNNDAFLNINMTKHYASIACINQIGGNSFKYLLLVYNWDANYKITETIRKTYDVLENSPKKPYLAMSADNNMLVNTEHIFRYNGDGWTEGELTPITAGADVEISFVGMDNYAASWCGSAYSMKRYNPYKNRFEAVNLDGGSPSCLSYGVTFGGPYFTVGNGIYFENNEGTIKKDPQKLPNNVLENRIISTPNFIACQTTDGITYIYLFENGQVCDVKTLNKKLYLGGVNNHGYFASPDIFVTYSSTGKLNGVTLHKVLNKDVEGRLNDVIVDNIVTNDGYQDYINRYEYDSGDVLISQNGMVTGYSKAVVIPEEGRIELSFFNGLSERQFGTNEHYYSILQGDIFEKSVYNSSGKKMTGEKNYYSVKTTRERLSDGTQTQLCGFTVQLDRREHSEFADGNTKPLITGTNYTYDGVTGLPLSEAYTDFDNSGNRIDVISEYYPAWRYYDGVKEQNCLTAPMLAKKTANDKPFELQLTEYGAHKGVWCAKGTYKALNKNASLTNWETKSLRPEYWFVQDSVIARSDTGAAIETYSAGEGSKHIIMDKNGFRTIAEFINAKKDDSFFYGFESYEKNDSLQLYNASICGDDFYTGETSAKINPCGGIKYVGQLELQLQDYIISGFAKKAEALKVYIETSNGKTLLDTVVTDMGGWEYWQAMVPKSIISPGSFELCNDSKDVLLIDCVCLAPKLSKWKAVIYHKKTGERIEEITCGGRIERYFYNNNFACIGKTALDGYVSNLSLNYRDNDDVFDKNKHGTLELAFQKKCEAFWFRDKNEIQRVWDMGNGYVIKNNGQLIYQNGGTLRFKNQTSVSDVCVYVDWANTGDRFELQYGENTKIGWEKGRGYYLINGAAEYWQSGELTRQWALITSHGSLLVYAGGYCVFSKKLVPTGNGITLSFGNGAGITRAIVGEAPSATILYKDGYNRLRQSHMQNDGKWVIDETSYDGLQRVSVITTKKEKDAPPDGYDSQFLPGILKSKDFPYYKLKYEDFLSDRVVAQSLPGGEYCMDSSKGRPQTIKYTFNQKGEWIENSPQSVYYVKETTDMEGVKTKELTSISGRCLMKITDGISRCEYDSAGNLISICLPEKQSITMKYDFIGNKISSNEPDVGVTNYSYDYAARLRFYSGAEDAANKRICYNKYDAIGRLIESGVLNREFSDDLTGIARNNPGYPENGDWLCRYIYDSDGNEPDMLGRLHKAVVRHGNGDVTEESFRYNKNGNVIEKNAFNGMQVGYKYSINNKLTDITYPTEALTVHYEYNSFGNISEISAPGMDGYIAKYSYDENGKLKSRLMSGGKLTRECRYNIRGGLTGVCDDTQSGSLLTQELYYEKTKDGNKGRYDGHISEYDCGGFDISSYKFDYNQRKQLVKATNCHTYEYKYDLNGNMTSENGYENKQYSYAKGSNRVEKVTGDKSVNISYSLSGQVIGASHLGITGIAYHPVNGQPLEIKKNTGNSFIEYNGMGEKITQKTPKTERVYISGGTAGPLSDFEKDGTQRHYIYGPDGMVAFIENKKMYYIIRDYKYSARLITDSLGNPLCRWDYEQFGAVKETPVAANIPQLRYLYTGQELDEETGLFLFPSRIYDPFLAVFYMPDKKRQYASPYLYCNNNPVNLIDPDGELAITTALLIGAGIGLLIGAGFATYKGISAGKTGWELAGYIAIGGTIGAVGGALSALSGLACFGIGAAAVSAGLSTGAAIGLSATAGAAMGASIQISKSVAEYYVNELFEVQNDMSLANTIISGAITGAVSGAILGVFAGYGGTLAGAAAKAWNHDISNFKALSEAYCNFTSMSAFDMREQVGLTITKFVTTSKIVSAVGALSSAGAGQLYGLMA